MAFLPFYHVCFVFPIGVLIPLLYFWTDRVPFGRFYDMLDEAEKHNRTVALMDTYLEQNGYVNDINKDRLHHEIYMSDARKVAPEKWKTVIRHPIRRV